MSSWAVCGSCIFRLVLFQLKHDVDLWIFEVVTSVKRVLWHRDRPLRSFCWSFKHETRTRSVDVASESSRKSRQTDRGTKFSLLIRQYTSGCKCTVVFHLLTLRALFTLTPIIGFTRIWIVWNDAGSRVSSLSLWAQSGLTKHRTGRPSMIIIIFFTFNLFVVASASPPPPLCDIKFIFIRCSPKK